MSLPLKYKLYKKKKLTGFLVLLPIVSPVLSPVLRKRKHNKCSSKELMKAHPENRASGVIMT